MNIVKLFVSLMILFVAVNLIITLYRYLNRSWREGLENLGTSSSDSSSMNCPAGCVAPTELSGNCNSLEKDANGNYYKTCPYECTKTFGSGCELDQQCTPCGSRKITGLWDKNGNKSILKSFKEEKKSPRDYRRDGVTTSFTGIGLFLFGEFFLGAILKGVGALVFTIGIGLIIAGYLYPRESEEINKAVEDFEKR